MKNIVNTRKLSTVDAHVLLIAKNWYENQNDNKIDTLRKVISVVCGLETVGDHDIYRIVLSTFSQYCTPNQIADSLRYAFERMWNIQEHVSKREMIEAMLKGLFKVEVAKRNPENADETIVFLNLGDFRPIDITDVKVKGA